MREDKSGLDMTTFMLSHDLYHWRMMTIMLMRKSYILRYIRNYYRERFHLPKQRRVDFRISSDSLTFNSPLPLFFFGWNEWTCCISFPCFSDCSSRAESRGRGYPSFSHEEWVKKMLLQRIKISFSLFLAWDSQSDDDYRFCSSRTGCNSILM